MAEVYTAINTLQERVLTAQNNVKRGLANIAVWGDIPLHNRKENPDKLELLAVNERHSRFCKRLNFELTIFVYTITYQVIFTLFYHLFYRRNQILNSHAEFEDILKTNYKLFFNIKDEDEEEVEEEELEEVDESTLDDDEKAARAAKLAEIMAHKEERRLAKEERDREKAEAEVIKNERRALRRLKRETKEAERMERQERRDAGK